MAAAAVMASSCQKSPDYEPVVPKGSSEISIEITRDYSTIDFENDSYRKESTKAGLPDEDGRQPSDTGAFMVTLAPFEDEGDLTKASEVSSLPSSLNWLCTTGSAGSQTVRWGPSALPVSGGRVATGKYQNASPTTYNHYLSNVDMSVSDAGVTVAADGSKDVIVGAATSSSATPAIALKHILARTGSVSVKLPEGASADCSIADLSVTIKAVTGGTSGTYNFNTDSWSGVSGLGTATALTGSSDMYLVPGQYIVSASFTLKKGTGGWNVSRTGTITLKAGCINNITLNNTDIVTHEVEITKYSGALKVGRESWWQVKYYTRTNGVKDAGVDISGHSETTITASNGNVKFYYPSVSGARPDQKNGVIGVSSGNVRLTATFRGVSGYIDVNIEDEITHSIEVTKYSGGTLYVGSTNWFLVKYYTTTNGVKNSGQDISGNTSMNLTASNSNVKFYYPSVSSDPTKRNGVIGVAPGNVRLTATYAGVSGYIDVEVFDNSIVGTTYEYRNVDFKLGSIADIPASGGTSAAPAISEVTMERRSKNTHADATVSYGEWVKVDVPSADFSPRYSQTNVFANFSTTHTGFTAGSLGATVKDRTKVGTMYVIVLANGVYSSTKYTDVYQQANAVTNTTVEYAKPTFTLGSIADIPASGGTSAAPAISGVSQQARSVYTYTSTQKANGAWYTLSPAPSYSPRYSQTNVFANFSTTHAGFYMGSLGTAVKDRTKVGTMYVIVLANGVYSDTQYRDVYQAANAKTYGAITISQFSYATPAWNSTETVTPTLTYGQAVSYTSGASGTTTDGLSKTFSHSNTAEFSLNGTTGGIKVDAIPTATVWDNPVITSFGLAPNPAPPTASVQVVSFSYSQNRRRSIPDRSDVATVTISGNGKSATKTATRTQKGNSDVITTESGSFDGANIPSSAPYTVTLEKYGSAPVDFTISRLSGLMTKWGSGNGTRQRTAEVKLTFTMNGKSSVAYATSVQSAKPASGPDPAPTYTVAIDKTQLYVELCHQSDGGIMYNNYGTDKFTVRSNGTDVTGSCTKTGYDTSIISVDANGTVHFVGDGETTITVTYRDANGDTHTFNVHVRSYEYWETV